MFDDPEWTHIPNETKEFVAACLTVKVADRPSASALLKHTFMESGPAGDATV